MPSITNSANAALFDEAAQDLIDALGKLNGISKSTKAQIGRLTELRSDGPPPHDDEQTVLFERVVLSALAQNALAVQKKASSAKKK